MTSWFAVYCRNEFKVETALRELGYDAYCPTEIKWHRERKIRRIVRWPLLPGYVFPGLSPTLHGPDGPEFPFEAVRAIEGVVDFVRSCGDPARLPYDPPNADAEEARTNAWQERRRTEFNGHRLPEEPPPRPRTLGEIRAMEDAGDFDFTQDRIVAERASRLVRRSFGSFTELAQALSDKQAA